MEAGVYRSSCVGEHERSGDVCHEQDLRLNLLFAISSTTYNVSTLPAGTLLDRYGPRFTSLCGCVCLALGTSLMSAAFYIPNFDGFVVASVFLSLGGTLVFIPSFAIANAFPRHAGSIVSCMTGAFEASSAVFLLLDAAHIPPETFFAAYLAVPALIFAANLTLMNEYSYKTEAELETKIARAKDATQDVHDSDEELTDSEVKSLRAARRTRRESKLDQLDELLGDADEREERRQKEESQYMASGVIGALHGQSVKQQMTTPWFSLLALLVLIQMSRMNLFIATIQEQYQNLLQSKPLAVHVLRFFDAGLPVSPPCPLSRLTPPLPRLTLPSSAASPPRPSSR